MAGPFRVLVVDDSAFMRSALSRRIETDPRFKVIDTASDGRDGVEKALRLKPDVVTLDVDMPVMNGIEALRAIMSRSSIPVVMVSAVTESEVRATIKALEIGAIDFIPKAKGAERIHETLLAAVSAHPLSANQRIIPTPRRMPFTPPPRTAPIALTRADARIIVIGSSTGGPQALQAVLSRIPANLPVPIVAAQHMSAQFTLALANRLDETCPLRVVEARNGDALTAGTAYIAPGGMQLRLTPSCIKVDPDRGESLHRPSVEVLAASAQASFGKHVLGVMLTGMGNDGLYAFTSLYEAGGHNIVQDEASCVVYGMPRAVAEAGGANEILPLDKIGERICGLFGV
jgi:two-component system chemotaxis response regulator CheB